LLNNFIQLAELAICSLKTSFREPKMLDQHFQEQHTLFYLAAPNKDLAQIIHTFCISNKTGFKLISGSTPRRSPG
jgi:hypothetical protein